MPFNDALVQREWEVASARDEGDGEGRTMKTAHPTCTNE